MEDNKIFEKITKEELIKSRQNYMDENVKLSNELFKEKQKLKKLIEWIQYESEEAGKIAESSNTGNNTRIAFLGHKIAYEKTLERIKYLGEILKKDI